MQIKKVGVLGFTGTMGLGIAQVCAQSGFQVVASSRNEERSAKGLATITGILTRAVDKGRITQQDKEAALSRIKTTTDTRLFSDCDIVIEVAAEDLELKKKLFAEMDTICKPEAILASNTSVLPLVEIAMATKRPEKVVGLHFFNPPPVMKLIEIIRTIRVSSETMETTREFAKALGKTVVVVPDTPGYIVNRLVVPFILDAIRLLEGGIAPKEDIDAAINLGLNHPMGPLALADLIGNDIVLDMADSLYKDLLQHEFIAPTMLRRMVAAGWLGRKSGKGFYDYK